MADNKRVEVRVDVKAKANTTDAEKKLRELAEQVKKQSAAGRTQASPTVVSQINQRARADYAKYAGAGGTIGERELKQYGTAELKHVASKPSVEGRSFAASIAPYFKDLGKIFRGSDDHKRAAGFTQGARKFGTSMGMPGSGIMEGWQQITGSIDRAVSSVQGFMSATAPSAWRQFTGSIQLLGGEIAGLLIPAFVEASAVIQRAWRWIQNLDEGTKGTIRSWAMWGGVVIGASTALRIVAAPIIAVANVLTSVLGVGFRLASGAIQLFTTVLGTLIPVLTRASVAMYAFAVAHPIIAGLGAIAIAVGVLTNGFGLLGNRIAEIGRRADESRERLQRLAMGGAMTPEDFRSLPTDLQSQLQQAQTPERRAEIARRHMAATQERITALQGTNPDRLATTLQARLEGMQDLGWHRNRQAMRANALRDIMITDINHLIRPDVASRRLAGLDLSGARLSPEDIRRIVSQASGQNDLTNLQGQVAVLQGVANNGVPQGTGVAGRSWTRFNQFFELMGSRTPNQMLEGLAGSGLGRAIQEIIGVRGNGEATLTGATPVNPQMYGGGQAFYEAMFTEALGRDQIEQARLEQIVRNTERTAQAQEAFVAIMGQAGQGQALAQMPTLPGAIGAVNPMLGGAAALIQALAAGS